MDTVLVLEREKSILDGRARRLLRKLLCACGFSSLCFCVVWCVVLASVGVGSLCAFCRDGSLVSFMTGFLLPSPCCSFLLTFHLPCGSCFLVELKCCCLWLCSWYTSVCHATSTLGPSGLVLPCKDTTEQGEERGWRLGEK